MEMYNVIAKSAVDKKEVLICVTQIEDLANGIASAFNAQSPESTRVELVTFNPQQNEVQQQA